MRVGALLFFCLPLMASELAPEQLQKQDVSRSRLHLQTHSLMAGEREVLALVGEGTQAQSKGVAILLSDAEAKAFSQDNLLPLAGQLQRLGWHTLLMAAPYLPELTPQSESVPVQQGEEGADGEKSTESAETASAGQQNNQQDLQHPLSASPHPLSGSPWFSEAQFTAQQQQIQLQMLAARDYASQYPGFVLVIAQGMSAAWLTRLYAEQTLLAPDALVMVDAYWPAVSYNRQLAEYVATTPMPLLDIYGQHDNHWAALSQPQRRIAARQRLKLQYRQRELAGQPATQAQAIYLSREIYGWLRYLGW